MDQGCSSILSNLICGTLVITIPYRRIKQQFYMRLDDSGRFRCKPSLHITLRCLFCYLRPFSLCTHHNDHSPSYSGQSRDGGKDETS